MCGLPCIAVYPRAECKENPEKHTPVVRRQDVWLGVAKCLDAVPALKK